MSQNGPQTTLAIWDNGNNRILNNNGDLCTNPALGTPNPCYSRATVFSIDESTHVANLDWEDLPGLFSIWGGSIKQLDNGNIELDLNAPAFPATPNLASQVQDLTHIQPAGGLENGVGTFPMYAYRAIAFPVFIQA